MTTQYTTILKLALPVQGELSGSWGDVVNDNITEMVEEAVAGLATINSWTANSHTLTTANGTTSESRCAVLVADDDGGGNPSAAATIICPSATKLYVLKNISGQQVTLKTAAGTGVAVPNGSTGFLFCDGTNVEACQTDIIDATTIDTTNLEVTNIKAKDGTASGSIANSTGVFTINSAVLTTADINGGTIDGTVIGGSSAAAGTFTTFTSTGIDDNASSTAVTIDSSQNVGIGTASPSYLLDLYKSASTVARVRNTAATGGTPSTTHGEFVIESTDANMGMQFLGSTTADQRILFSDTGANSGQIAYNHTNNYMALYTAAAERMRITSTGNVGIGTTSPSTKTEISTNNETSILRLTDTATIGAVDRKVGGIEFYQNDASGGAGIGSSIEAYHVNISGDTDLRFATGDNTERMRIDSSGNVGINTTTTLGAKLFVSQGAAASPATSGNMTTGAVIGSSAAGQALNVGTDADGVWYNAAYANNAGVARIHRWLTGGTERMRIDSSGNLGIGTSSPSTKLGFPIGNNIKISQVAGTAHLAGNVGSLALTIADGGGHSGVFVNNTHNGTYSSQDITFLTAEGGISAATERMRIYRNGNVGIGTASPAKQLHITKASKADIGTLTDGATITPNFDANQNFSVTLGGNRTLANPTNADGGQTGSIFITQDGTGGRTLSFGAYWKFPGGTAPTLTTTASAVDRIDYIVKSSTEIHAVASLNLS